MLLQNTKRQLCKKTFIRDTLILLGQSDFVPLAQNWRCYEVLKNYVLQDFIYHGALGYEERGDGVCSSAHELGNSQKKASALETGLL